MPDIIVHIDNEAIVATGELLEEVLSRQEEAKIMQEQKLAEAQAKAAQRQAILDRLGLTEEEAQLLLGGN